MVVLLTCKNEEDPIENEGARVPTRLYNVFQFFRHSRAANSAVRGRIRPKFELIKAYIVALITCKNEEDPIKNEGAINFSHIISLWEFFQTLKRS